MKKVTFMVAAFAALSLVSCRKERTCSCSTTETHNYTVYDYDFDSNGDLIQLSDSYSETGQMSSESTYAKVSKKFGNENCPKSYTDSSPYDNTSSYLGITTGQKGEYKTTSTCELK